MLIAAIWICLVAIWGPVVYFSYYSLSERYTDPVGAILSITTFTIAIEVAVLLTFIQKVMHDVL